MNLTRKQWYNFHNGIIPEPDRPTQPQKNDKLYQLVDLTGTMRITSGSYALCSHVKKHSHEPKLLKIIPV